MKWDGFDAATLDDYRTYGKVIDDPRNIAEPDGTPLFGIERGGNVEALYTLTRADVQLVAQGMLGRVLSETEMAAVAAELPGVINWMDPTSLPSGRANRPARSPAPQTGICRSQNPDRIKP